MNKPRSNPCYHVVNELIVILNLCFMCSLWRDLNINCCDKGSCNFYNSSSVTCKTLVYVHFYFRSQRDFLVFLKNSLNWIPSLSPFRWVWPLALCMKVDLMSMPCTWIVRVSEDPTKAMRGPWLTCLRTTWNNGLPTKWVLPMVSAPVHHVLIFLLMLKILTEVFRWSAFLCVSGYSPPLHQQHCSDELAEQRRREESLTHTRHTATVGPLQVCYCKIRNVVRWMWCQVVVDKHSVMFWDIRLQNNNMTYFAPESNSTR